VVLGGTPFYVIAAHYPHEDREQADFETENRERFAARRAEHEAAHPRWKGAKLLRGADRNFVYAD